MKHFFIIFTSVTLISAQVTIKDSWRPVSSPWDAARFRETLNRLHPLPFSSSAIRSGRIFGGELARLGQFPYYAFLFNVDTLGDTYVCGSAIISDNWLLTAAHCLDEIVKTSVYAGLIDRIKGPAVWTMDVGPKDYILHEDYKEVANDIALVRLAKPLLSSPFVDNVGLPKRSDVTVGLEGRMATVCGFGLVNDVDLRPSQQLRFMSQQIVANNVCARIFGSVNVKATNLCLNGSGGRSTCSGDSGGPLVTELVAGQKTLVGIVSFGAKSGCTLGHPLVFTRVTSYLDWIEKNSGIVIF